MTLDILKPALARLPHLARRRAGSATLLRAQGYAEHEIADVLGVDRRTLHRDRLALQLALIEASGLSVDEFERDFAIRVPIGAARQKDGA